MANAIGNAVESLGQIAQRVGVGVANAAGIAAAPAGVPQDLWGNALSSLMSHIGDRRLLRPYIVTLVDYRLDADTKRLWTVDLRSKQVLVNSLVSHGRGRPPAENPRTHVVRVSNEPHSHLSLVGGFVTEGAFYQSTAGQRGHARRRRALRVRGLDTTNSNAYDRAIVFHGAWYVSGSQAGRSEGCFATEQSVNDDLIPVILGGTFVYSQFR